MLGISGKCGSIFWHGSIEWGLRNLSCLLLPAPTSGRAHHNGTIYITHMYFLGFLFVFFFWFCILLVMQSLSILVCNAMYGAAPVLKNLPANAGDKRDVGSIPGSERSPGGGHGNPLQCSCLENPMDR